MLASTCRVPLLGPGVGGCTTAEVNLQFMAFSKPPSKRDRSLKRGRTEVNFPSLAPIAVPKPDNYSRFLVIESLDTSHPAASQSVFLIAKFLESLI